MSKRETTIRSSYRAHKGARRKIEIYKKKLLPESMINRHYHRRHHRQRQRIMARCSLLPPPRITSRHDSLEPRTVSSPSSISGSRSAFLAIERHAIISDKLEPVITLFVQSRTTLEGAFFTEQANRQFLSTP